MCARVLSPLFVLMVSLFAHGAAAQECASDADCPAGYACASYAQTCPDCPPDQVCDPCDPTTALSVCEIVPTTCAADADCEQGLVCVHFVGESCPGAVPCPVDAPDCTTEPAPCETVDESYCAPPYVAACTADADCGPGFTCESAEVCTCVAYPDPGNGEPPPPEDCTCEATGDSYCALTYQPCAVDADCPAGLVCADGNSSAAPCYVDANGAESCPGVDSQPFCAPPGYVTPLPLEGGGVAAERADDGSSDTIRICSASNAGGPIPTGALVVLVVLGVTMRRRR